MQALKLCQGYITLCCILHFFVTHPEINYLDPIDVFLFVICQSTHVQEFLHHYFDQSFAAEF